MTRTAVAATVLALAAAGSPGLPAAPPGGPAAWWVERGAALRVEPATLSVSVAGRFHPAAANVAAAPDGLLWGRAGERRLAALDPASGSFVAEVTLPLRPYNLLVAASGKAYVTHNTLTAEGFWVSVVDTRERRLLAPIKGIEGLRTSLAEGPGCVFLATMDVVEGGQLRLYRIDAATDQAVELRREAQRGCSWLVVPAGERVFVCRAARGPGAPPPRVDVLEAASGRLLRCLEGPALGRVRSFAGVPFSASGRAWLPCECAGGGRGIAMLDFEEEMVTGVLPIAGEAWQVLCADADLLVYAGPENGGREGVSLVFYDTREEREVKRVFLPDLLVAAERGNE